MKVKGALDEGTPSNVSVNLPPAPVEEDGVMTCTSLPAPSIKVVGVTKGAVGRLIFEAVSNGTLALANKPPENVTRTSFVSSGLEVSGTATTLAPANSG